MILQCPNCGRAGNLPDHLSDTARRVRCRRCNERFWTLPLRPSDHRNAQGELSDRRSEILSAAELPHVLRRGFFASDDEDVSLVGPDSLIRGPDDSQYELSAIFAEGTDPSRDSLDQLPAFSMDSAVPDAAHSAASLDPAEAEVRLAVPWYYRYIDAWGRFHFFTALGFAAVSLSILGFLLLRALVGGEVMHTSITALVVGCLGTIAFLLLSLSVAALAALLADLDKSVRHLNFQAEHGFRAGGDHAARNRPNLSRSVG
jgi:hypothetical protein